MAADNSVDPQTHDCGTPLVYNEEFDAHFCASCDVWTDAKCESEDPAECYFNCRNRPKKPSEAS